MLIRAISCAVLLTLLPLSEAVWGFAQVESRSKAQTWDPQAQGAPNPTNDLLKRIEFLQQEVQELRGKVEEQTYQFQQMQEQQKKLYLDLDRRLREGGPAKLSGVSNTSLEEREQQTGGKMQGGVDARLTTQFDTPEIEKPPADLTALPPEEEKVEEEKAYQNSYRLIQKKDYDSALLSFKSLIKTFPQGKYVPNAHYWLGEIYLVKGDLDLAALAFNEVFSHYPEHPKAADSLLKLGYVEYAKGQFQKSQTLLSKVKTQFPGSTSAQLADSRLQKMQLDGQI